MVAEDAGFAFTGFLSGFRALIGFAFAAFFVDLAFGTLVFADFAFGCLAFRDAFPFAAGLVFFFAGLAFLEAGFFFMSGSDE
jgi:hypothetical protein